MDWRLGCIKDIDSLAFYLTGCTMSGSEGLHFTEAQAGAEGELTDRDSSGPTS